MPKKSFTILLFLIICNHNFAQNGNYLDAILKLEKKLTKEKFLDTILTIKYEKALLDSKKYLLLTEKAEKIAEQLANKKLLAIVYSKKSLAYFFSSKPEIAIKNTIKASVLFKELNDFESYGDSFINLGWQIKNRDLNKALFYMNKGIKTLELKTPNSFKLSGAYNNYGVLKQRKEQLDSALYYHKKSLNICLLVNDSLGIPFAQTHIGEVFLKKKKFSKAEENFTSALIIRKKKKDIYGITDSYLYLGDLYFAKKEFSKAIYYYKLAERISIKNSYYPLRKYATEYIFKSYEKNVDIKNAYYYYKLFTKLKDSLVNIETNSKIVELETKFRTGEKEVQITKQKKELLEQELAIKNRNLYTVLLFAALIILGVVFFSIFKKNQFKRKQLQKEIDLKDALSTIKTQNRLQEQRLKISRDLHDNIGSQLTFIISSIDNLKYITKDANDKLKDKLSTISSFTSDTIHQLRDTIWAMNKPKITVEDLHVRILSFIEKAKTAYPNILFDVNYDIDKNVSFTSLVGMNVFRVIQEAINNTLKYAEATKIEVQLKKKNNLFEVIVRDNGIGFNINSVDLGNGLSNIENRMNEIDGKVSINSEIGKGTVIKIIILKTTS